MSSFADRIYTSLFKFFKIKSSLSFNYVNNITTISSLLIKLSSIEKERDRLFEELQAREQAFNKLVLSVYDWVWITDTTGKYSYVSPKCVDIYNITEDKIIGKMPHEFVEEKDKDSIIALEKHLLETHEVLVNYVSIVRANGNFLKTLTNAVPLFDFRGEYVGHIGVEKILESTPIQNKRYC